MEVTATTAIKELKAAEEKVQVLKAQLHEAKKALYQARSKVRDLT